MIQAIAEKHNQHDDDSALVKLISVHVSCDYQTLWTFACLPSLRSLRIDRLRNYQTLSCLSNPPGRSNLESLNM